jgi:hypothetical protein
MSLHYEDLCANAQVALDRISDFLGIDRSTLEQYQGEHHVIGNAMRLRALSEIREDISWQTQLRPRDLAVIARIAGPTSHRLGYTWP